MLTGRRVGTVYLHHPVAAGELVSQAADGAAARWPLFDTAMGLPRHDSHTPIYYLFPPFLCAPKQPASNTPVLVGKRPHLIGLSPRPKYRLQQSRRQPHPTSTLSTLSTLSTPPPKIIA